MIYKLAYGKRGLNVALSDHYNIDLIEPKWIESAPDQELAVTKALRHPYHSRPLKKIISKSDKIAIIFSDITRPTPYHIIIPALLNELQGIPQQNICFFCANGTHRLLTKSELVLILGSSVVDNFEIIQNLSNAIGSHEYVGTTTSGNLIWINKKLLEYDIKILTGFIEPHFFAGFSGGAKALIPGMAFEGSIKFNHSIKNLSHSGTRWGITNGNPLWEEIMEAAGFVRNLFLLNVTLNKNKEITNVFAGDLYAAHAAGCSFAKASAMVPVNTLYDIVITSNSGYPLDLNIYQTVKGMSAASQIVKNGGHILMLAECWDGIPSGSDYEKILSSVNGIDELMNYIAEKEEILKDTWQIYFQALIQQKAFVYLFSDKLEASVIRKTFLTPVIDIEKHIDELVKSIGPHAKICILPEGPQTIPYLQ